MISRITGSLIDLNTEGNTVQLEAGHLVYEVMVPGYTVSDLSQQIGKSVTLYCLEVYESTGGMGSNLVPCMVGFPQAADKAFFQQFIKVKGIGMRKALRTLTRPLADIAAMIEAGDAKMLATLPEIGQRTAEQVIAELKGKLIDFATAAQVAGRAERVLSAMQREALEILLQLGERRSEAEQLIERASNVFEQEVSTDTLVQAVYRLKSGSL